MPGSVAQRLPFEHARDRRSPAFFMSPYVSNRQRCPNDCPCGKVGQNGSYIPVAQAHTSLSSLLPGPRRFPLLPGRTDSSCPIGLERVDKSAHLASKGCSCRLGESSHSGGVGGLFRAKSFASHSRQYQCNTSAIPVAERYCSGHALVLGGHCLERPLNQARAARSLASKRLPGWGNS